MEIYLCLPGPGTLVIRSLVDIITMMYRQNTPDCRASYPPGHPHQHCCMPPFKNRPGAHPYSSCLKPSLPSPHMASFPVPALSFTFSGRGAASTTNGVASYIKYWITKPDIPFRYTWFIISCICSGSDEFNLKRMDSLKTFGILVKNKLGLPLPIMITI